MMAQLHDRLTAFLVNLECLDTEGRKDAIANEVMETGGTYVMPPKGHDTWSSHLAEITLHGISAMGATEEEAIRNWAKAANRHCRFVERVGFADRSVRPSTRLQSIAS